MRASISALLLVVIAGSPGRLLAQSPSPAPPTTGMSAELKTEILAAMRLNRRAFQAPGVLLRYQEERLKEHPAFAACELLRTSSGDPASQYPAPKARTTKRVHTDAAVLKCLETTGRLTDKGSDLLARHYFCGLPELSPDLRACFTFQRRPSSVSPMRSIVDDGFLPDGTKVKLEKGWSFLGSDPERAPDVATVLKACATDGRPQWIKNKTTGASLDIEKIHPTPTRPMCWIAETQSDLFQRLLDGRIDPPRADQIALLKEYYECDTLAAKVSKTLYNAFCQLE